MKGKFAAAAFPFYFFNIATDIFSKIFSYICDLNLTFMTFIDLRYRILACLTVLAVSSGFAADSTDLGAIEPDVTYSYDAMAPVEAVFTPAESGILRSYSTGDMIHAYSDPGHEQPVEAVDFYNGAAGEKVQVYEVVGGHTLYFYNAFPLNSGTFRISTGKEKVLLSRVTPAPEQGTLSLGVDYDLTVIFNIPVKCTRCRLEAGGESVEVPVKTFASSLSVAWSGRLMQWYRDGIMKEGDELTVTFTGIRDVNDSANRPDFGDGIGKLVLRYTVAGKPAELKEEINTPAAGMTDFMTYYLPGGQDGLVTLVFDTPLDTSWMPKAEISYGDIDNIEKGMYIENPPVSVADNAVTVDLRGVSRLPEEMIPGLPAQENIYLRISDIRSADSQNVWTGQASSPYSFGFSYRLRNVVYSIAADWMPLPGDPLNPGDSMEIWVLNGNRISFDSVDFSYLKDGVPATESVPYTALDVRDDPEYDDALLYYLTVPDFTADEDSEITVTFGGILCADGQDHSSDIFVRYRSPISAVGILPAAPREGMMFDMQGRMVTNPAPGIYVRDGRKIVVRQ